MAETVPMIDRPPVQPQPKATVPPELQPKPKTSFFKAGQNDVGSISLPKFKSDTGAVVGLLMLSMVWSVVRTWTENPSEGFSPASNRAMLKIFAGTWIVGLGVLIVHEFDPHVAMLFAVLVLVGNVLTNNAGNKAVIGALNSLFVGTGG